MTEPICLKGIKNPLFFNHFVFSDVHLGNQLTPTEHTLKCLDELLPAKVLRELDAIFIPGDFFDKLLTLPEDRVLAIQQWVCRFLVKCKKYDITLRVLEGTGSHDYKQSRMFVTINESAEINADVKYFDKVSIERLDRFGLTMLYIPDNVSHQGDVVWRIVQDTLRESGLEKVDIALTHGFFEFQMPAHIHSESTHIQARYEKIVRYAIYNGHHHTHRINGKVKVPGSTNRLKHGEEEAKGVLHSRLYQNGKVDVTFVENKSAKIYKTIDVTGLDTDGIYRKLDDLPELPYDSCIRLRASRSGALKGMLSEIKARYHRYSFSTPDWIADGVSLEEKIRDLSFKHEAISITKVNISSLLAERMKNNKLPDELIKDALRLLGEAL